MGAGEEGGVADFEQKLEVIGKMVCPFGHTVVVYSVPTTTSVGVAETVTCLQSENGSITVLESKRLL